MINTHNGIRGKLERIHIEDYPAVKDWLDNGGIAYNGKLYKGYSQIEKRSDQGDTPYNLRNCAYMEDFLQPKVMYAEIMRITKANVKDFPRFSLVDGGMYSNNSVHFFTGKHLESLVCMLNCEYSTWWFFNTVAVLDAGGMQMRKIFVENIPLPKLINNVTKENVDDRVYESFGFTREEIAFIKNTIDAKQKEVLRRNKDN